MFFPTATSAALCIAALISTVALAQTSLGYELVIQQKIQTYHGEWPGFDVVIDEEWFDPVLRVYVPPDLTDHFPPRFFTLRLPFANHQPSASESWRRITSNQALELTAALRVFRLSDDHIALSEFDARSRQP